MSMSGGCSCSLQARLHQVENARGREMKAHGELVQTLECELESRRTSEAELRLATAKLRTDNCRLEAELSAANAKALKLLGQLDNARSENAKCADEFKAVIEESERRLQAARDTSDQLLEEKRQLYVELSESQKFLECSRRDNKLLQAKTEEQCSQLSAQAEEIAKLSALVSSKQHEVDASVVRSQLLLEDLSSAQQQQNVMQERLKELERSLTRAVTTRNRALQWRRRRQEFWDNRNISYGNFLALKSLAIQSKLESAIDMAQCTERKRSRLKYIEEEILNRCSRAKEEMSAFRLACASERAQIQSLRDEMCREELPKLLLLLERLQMGFDTQHQEYHAQFMSQKERIRSQEERLDMSRHDIESRVQNLQERYQAQLTHRKLQQHAIFQAVKARRYREIQRHTFTAWKEFHLRSLVGQVTHTAMVFQSQQSRSSMAATTKLSSPSKYQQYATPMSKFDDCLRSPASEAVTPIDTMWRKWRRVDVGAAGREHKPRPSTNIPS